MLNKWMGMGRLTKDPELRKTGNDTSVTTFTIAVDRDRKPKDGEKETDFVDVVAWRHTAEFVSKYFSKGRMAIVEGRLQFREYTDREGNKRKAAEIVAENIYFGDSKKEKDADSYGAESVRPDAGGTNFQEIEGPYDDLPF